MTDPVVLWLLFGGPFVFFAFGLIITFANNYLDRSERRQPGE